MKKKSTRFLVEAALIAGLYTALTYGQGFLFPGTTSMAIQFRVSEVLCLLATFTPAAIPGLTVGCLLSNIVNITVLPLDVLFGTVASFLAAFAIYKLRKVTIKGLPIIGALMPVLFNGIIIGLEISIFIPNDFNSGLIAFLVTAGSVALGELGVCLILGLPFAFAIKKTNLFKDYIER